MRAGRTATLSFVALWALPASAQNWPQWRGPDADGTSSQTGLPVEWSESRNIVWKLSLPAVSGATPISWGDVVFLNVGAGRDLSLWAIDKGDGRPLWVRPLGGGNRVTRKQNMSSPSPVTDGSSVWVLTGTGVVKAFDFEGRLLWTRAIEDDFGRFGLNWGYASSPLLHDGRLVVQVLHGMKTDDPSYVMALDAGSGETLWRVERPTDAKMESPDSYTTPALLETEEGAQIVISGANYVTGHDAATGEELWRGGGLNPRDRPNYRVIASPVVKGDLIYVPTRVKPLIAFRSGGRGDITDSHKLFELAKGPDVPTPVTDGKVLYVVTDRGLLSKYDALTGELVWGDKRLATGTYSASPVLADGKIYVTNEAGVTTVVRVDPDFEVLAENSLEGYTLSSFAISEGRLFLRNDKALYCIGEG